TRSKRDWSSDVCSSDLGVVTFTLFRLAGGRGSFATVKAWLVAGLVAVALRAAPPVAACAQDGPAAPVPAVDPSWLQVDSVTKTRSEERRVGKEYGDGRG